MRSCEAKAVKWSDVSKDEAGYWIKFYRSKGRVKRQFTTLVPRRQSDWIPVKKSKSGKLIDYDPAAILDQYIKDVEEDTRIKFKDWRGRFFRGCCGVRGKKFSVNALGKNRFSEIGKLAARELGLDDPDSYTGHCWRRSAATNSSDEGIDVQLLMRMMGWRSVTTAMGYIDRSKKNSYTMAMYLVNVQRTQEANLADLDREHLKPILERARREYSGESGSKAGAGTSRHRRVPPRSLGNQAKTSRNVRMCERQEGNDSDESDVSVHVADPPELPSPSTSPKRATSATATVTNDLSQSSVVSQNEPKIFVSQQQQEVVISQSVGGCTSSSDSKEEKFKKLLAAMGGLKNYGTINIHFH
jgi:hypothetical protein